MTSDRDTAEAELVYAAVDRLWEQDRPGTETQDAPLEDVAIAHESGVDLESVRRWLDEAAGARYEVGTFGNTRTVARRLQG